MAAQKKSPKNKKQSRFAWSISMSKEQKSLLLKYSGVIMFLFALFTLVSTVSYLFTWQQDQSLLSQPGADVANMGGRLGLSWSTFLVARFLGLGSLAFVFILGVFAYRLFFWQKSIGLVKMTLVTVSGAFIASLALSLFGSSDAFGGGLGGDAGQALIDSLNGLVGSLVTIFIVVALVVLWFLCASGRFAHWFALTGEKSGNEDQAEEESGTEEVTSEEDADDVDDDEEEVEEVKEIKPETEETQETAEEDVVYEDEFEKWLVEDQVEPETDTQSPEDDDSSEEVPELAAVPLPEGEPSSEIEVIRADNLTSEVTEELPRIDNREEIQKFEFPSLDLLKDYSEGQHKVSQMELDINNNRIRTTLQNYKIDVDKVTAVVGPTVTLYKVVPAPGVRVSSIENLRREIAMALGASGVRVVTLADSVGIEVPNSSPSIVPLKSMLNSDAFRNSDAELPIALGYTITQEVKTFDLTDAPHLLVAGATKQGKSVGLNVIISSLLYSKHPSELKFVFIDPKMVEFTAYNSLLKHYLAVLPTAASEEDEKKNAIIKTPQQAEQVLNSLCIEMDERYNLLAAAGVNDFKLYNEKYKDRYLLPTEGHKFLPYLVVVIDEYADLIMAGGAGNEAKKSAKNIEASIIRLAQKGRAAGIHVIIATQRPSVNVITGLIKANFPTRIAFRVLSGTDSRTILDSVGAENLIGKGDMLYYAGVKMERIQCALVSMPEINKVTDFIGKQTGYKQCYNTPYYLPVPVAQDGEAGGGMIDMQNVDSLFEDAARMVVTTQKGSTSDLQRKLGMGYARAGRVMDQLEAAGIVGPQEGSKPRRVLVADLNELEEVLTHFIN